MGKGMAAGIGLVAALITLAAALIQVGAFGDFRLPGPVIVEPGGGGSQQGPGSCNAAMVEPALSLSVGSGPSGTEVTVSGSGFCPDADLEILFHTETVQFARTDADGAFSVGATIPGTFDFSAPMQYQIIATGAGTARTPFALTAR